MFFNLFNKRKKYGHIISLGYNCEVSFQFFLKYKFVESSLFAWVNTVDCKRLTFALNNLDLLTAKGLRKAGIMYEDIATGIYFHGKDMDTEEKEKEELTNRILYLKDKFEKSTVDGKKNLYIFKYLSQNNSEKQVSEDILNLYNTLSLIVKNQFDLLIILEENQIPVLSFNFPNLYIRKVDFFTPENNVTSKPYDKKHFNKIFSEFTPDFKLPKTKHFKFEDK